jgi:hypothetical protein
MFWLLNLVGTAFASQKQPKTPLVDAIVIGSRHKRHKTPQDDSGFGRWNTLSVAKRGGYILDSRNAPPSATKLSRAFL